MYTIATAKNFGKKIRVNDAPKKRDTLRLKKDWEPCGGILSPGKRLRFGDVICTVEQHGKLFDAVVRYTESRQMRRAGTCAESHRQFSEEDDAREWCVLEALRLSGYQIEKTITIKGLERPMVVRVKPKKKNAPPSRARVCRVTANAGKTTIKAEMNLASASEFSRLFRATRTNEF